MKEESLIGKVISAHGAIFNVQIDNKVVQCKLRGKLRLQDKVSTSPVVVGDNVKIRVLEDGTGVIEEVFERFNKLYRRAVGKRELEHIIVVNIDQAIVVTSFNMPYVPWGFVDRLLIASERNKIKPIICINKIDLLEKRKEVNDFVRVYNKKVGYEIIKTSAETGEGLDLLKQILKDKTSVFVGQSGVGKSALINAIEPGLNVRTTEVSEKTGKGRHTTSHTELHPLSFGGFIADTPGIKEFGLAGIEKSELGFYFPEFRKFVEMCKFSNCTHTHEPDCAVKNAVHSGKIDKRRYMSYVNILNSLEED
ncbi:MAG: ribosome small subunit-dependent GTPase A [Candidatus Kryptonium sp.]